MYIWLIVLSVLLGLSVFMNIELWITAKEIKADYMELKENGTQRTNSIFDNATK